MLLWENNKKMPEDVAGAGEVVREVDSVFFRRNVLRGVWLLWAVLFVFFSGVFAVRGGQEEGGAEQQQINIPVPHGEDVLGIRIPHYNEKNELVLLIVSDVSRRKDDDNIEMEKMKIDFYDQDRKRMVVSMPMANFHTPTKKLAKIGEGEAVIERDDFTIRGKNLEFDIDAQTGVMKGEVTMTVRGISDINSEKKEP